MLNDHAPWVRLISDQATATDRQWLRMLSEAFEYVSHDALVRSGMKSDFATEVLGMVALDARMIGEDALLSRDQQIRSA